MKKILTIIFCLTIISCKTSFPNDKKLSYTASVKIGDDWLSKKELLGIPDKAGDNFSSFFSQGMIVYISDDGIKVNGLVFTWFKDGLHFTGEVYGIKIGDTYLKLVKIWGEPAESSIAKEDYYEKMWQFKKFGIVVQFWIQPGDNTDIGGHYEKDTVKRIQING